MMGDGPEYPELKNQDGNIKTFDTGEQEQGCDKPQSKHRFTSVRDFFVSGQQPDPSLS
jgi:hypothetical protein